jgi:hypothetical protein
MYVCVYVCVLETYNNTMEKIMVCMYAYMDMIPKGGHVCMYVCVYVCMYVSGRLQQSDETTKINKK